MANEPIITNKDQFIDSTVEFLNTIFEPVLENKLGEIEIRVFPQNQPPSQYFFSSEGDAAQQAYSICNQDIDVYFGVNPRTGKGGKKENIHYVGAFHAEIDYGNDGHKKESKHKIFE